MASMATKSKYEARKTRTRVRKGLEKPKEYTKTAEEALKAAGL